MKSIRSLILLAAALCVMASPALASQTADVQSTTTATYTNTTTTFSTIATLTTVAVASGTNIYFVIATVPYVETGGLDGQISFELLQGATLIPSTLILPPGGKGFITIIGTVANLAGSTVITLKGKVNTTPDTLSCANATLAIIGSD